MERLVRRRQHIRPIGRISLMALLLTMAILGLATAAQCAPTVSAFLDAQRFSVDQAATLTITINDADGTIGELPVVDGLIFQQRGQSSQHQFVNGSLSSSISTLFQLQALRPGGYTIPAIPVTVDGKELLTEPITFEVTPPAAGISSQQGGGEASSPLAEDEVGQLAFLRISPVKQESYSGELLPIEIKAYFRRGLRASLNSRPRVNGDSFVLTDSKQEPVQTEEMVGNVPYSVLTWPGALSAIKEGSHTVSVAIEATLLVPASNKQRRLPLGGDPFFGNDPFADFFNRQQLQEKKIQIVSKEMDLQVLPLPAEGRPVDFRGAIGRFELQVEAQPTDVGPGDPITLTLTVQGSGNFDRVDAPVLSEAEGWKIYPPSAKFTPGRNMGQGSKVFDQALIAKGEDKTTIPPLSFSFFDPETREYQTLHSDPIPLHVSKAENGGKTKKATPRDEGQGQTITESSTPQKGSGEEKEPSASGDIDLAPLHPQLGPLQQDVIPLVTRTSFRMVMLILFLLLVAVILFRIRAGRLAADPLLCRSREMTRLLDLRLFEIEKARGHGNTRDFLALCRKTMQEQLGIIWQTEPGAITLADLHQHLAPDAQLIGLFTTAEGSAYAGHLLSGQEMAEYALKLEQELRQLR